MNVLKRWQEEHRRNNEILMVTVEANARRLVMIGTIGLGVSIAHMVAFFFLKTNNALEAHWRQAILIAHSGLFVLMGVLIVVGLSIRHSGRSYPLTYRYFQTILMMAILGFGIVTTAIDQWVTTNITAFVLASLITGLIFYTRPSKAALLFPLSWLVFAMTLYFTIDDAEVRLTNQINGLTASALGLFISIVIWQNKAQTITQHQTIITQQEALLKTNERLDYLARHDPLTGLLNRGAFMTAVTRELADSTTPSCLIMADIDYFKAFNDEYGHPKGDALLSAFSKRLKQQMRPEDLVCRWGGEEFVIYMPHTDVCACQHRAELMRIEMTKTSFKVAGIDTHMEASFGITEIMVDQENPFDSAYERVDKALYLAKSQGRNRVEVSHLETLK